MSGSESSGNDLVAGLVALLDLLDKPAAAVAAGGAIVGANRLFAELSSEMGVSVPPLEQAFDARARETLRRWVDAARPVERAPLTFRDGRSRSVRAERVAGASEACLLLVVDEPRRALRLSPGTATLRHDLAGPLTAILGTTELLLVRGHDLPREVRDSLGEILENCGRISEILARHRREEPGTSAGDN
ncbi:MAG: hypothetical protein JSV80_01520 [Acidobacteriota bacterium]|nr:MAG: hypothetical protein JSV80_01520 [Acidobacteriota bacterium]